MLEKSLGSFFIIAAMLNISTVTVPHSIGSLSDRLILLFVSMYTTIFEQNGAVASFRIRDHWVYRGAVSDQRNLYDH